MEQESSVSGDDFTETIWYHVFVKFCMHIVNIDINNKISDWICLETFLGHIIYT